MCVCVCVCVSHPENFVFHFMFSFFYFFRLQTNQMVCSGASRLKTAHIPRHNNKKHHNIFDKHLEHILLPLAKNGQPDSIESFWYDDCLSLGSNILAGGKLQTNCFTTQGSKQHAYWLKPHPLSDKTANIKTK